MADNKILSTQLPDFSYLLSSQHRDFLIRNNGHQVKIKDLGGKIVGLYFSASWCSPCHRFTPKLIETYEDLSSNGDFEVVYISSDRDEESFEGYFSKMPWLAIPFSDSIGRDSLDEKFRVFGIPHLVILDGEGRVLADKGVELVTEHQARAYPFSSERINQLKEEEEEAKRNQSLTSLLVSSSRDYVISSDEKKISVSELEGKMVALYFCDATEKDCIEFTPKLLDMYNKLKDTGEKFEVVLIYFDDSDEAEFRKEISEKPWFALPFKDQKIDKLARYFELRNIPTLVIIGPDGKTLYSDAVELVDEHGVTAYPFTSEKLAELAEIEKARCESETLESILVLGEKDYVIDKSVAKVPVSQLIGKHVLIYFSANWCPRCCAFTQKLVETYHEIKTKEKALEIIFVSSDHDQTSFDEYYADMPWLALPFGDERKALLSRKFKVKGIPSLMAIGPEGKTVTTKARPLIQAHGADAFPFTEDRIKELKERLEETVKGWPEKIKNELHEHELVKVRRNIYFCDVCENEGSGWSFWCERCDFDADPNCAMENYEKEKQKDVDISVEVVSKAGYICEGDVCRRI